MTAIERHSRRRGHRPLARRRGAGAPVIEISDVWKLHKLGDEVVKALIAVELQVMPANSSA